MAEQVRLRGSNQQLRVPRVNFAAEQEIARGRNQLANNLNRLSNFVMSMAEDKAKIEGAEYGALNAPTAEQINDAFVAGEELELPGDDRTVFGRNARRAALSIAGDEISALASNRATELTTLYEQSLTAYGQSQQFRDAAERDFGVTDFSPGALADKLDEVAAGYGGVLDETSPALAREFRAKQGITNHSSYAGYLEEYVKVENKRLETKFRAAHQQDFSVPNIAKMLRGPKGNDVLNKRVQEAKNKAVTFLTGSALKTFLDNMDKISGTAAKQIVSDGTFATERPTNTIGLISQGKVTTLPLAVQNGIKELRNQGMSFTDIGKSLRDERAAQLNFADAEQKLANERSERNEPGAIALVRKSMSSGNTREFDLNIKTLADINPQKAQELTDEFNDAGRIRTVSDPKIKEVVQNLAAADDLSFDDIEKYAPGLSFEDQKTLNDLVDSQESQELTAAKDILSAFDLPPTYTVISENDENFEKAQIARRGKAELTRRFQEAKRKGLDFDGIAIADTIAENISKDFKTVEIKLKKQAADKKIANVNSIQNDLKDANRPFKIFENNDYEGVINYLKGQKNLEPKQRDPGIAKQNDAIDSQIKTIETYLETQE